MISSLKSLFTFKIVTTFDEWAAIFDSAGADKRHSKFYNKPLFRGVRKDGSQKVIFIHQVLKENIKIFIESSANWILTYKVDLSTI